MWLPNSISRSSLAVLLVGAAASDVPLPSPDRAVAIRPDATVTVTIDAPIYQGKLGVDTGVVGAALADTLVALLRSEYGFARWGTSTRAKIPRSNSGSRGPTAPPPRPLSGSTGSRSTRYGSGRPGNRTRCWPDGPSCCARSRKRWT